jgi:hypothetical protein
MTAGEATEGLLLSQEIDGRQLSQRATLDSAGDRARDAQSRNKPPDLLYISCGRSGELQILM